MEELGIVDEKWKLEQIENTKKLLDAFGKKDDAKAIPLQTNELDYGDVENQLGDVSKLSDKKQLENIESKIVKLQATKFNVKKLITRIKKPIVKLVSKTTVIERTDVVDNQTVQIYQPEKPNRIPRRIDKHDNSANKIGVVENPKIVEPTKVEPTKVEQPTKVEPTKVEQPKMVEQP